jgi:hypothetical protein
MGKNMPLILKAVGMGLGLAVVVMGILRVGTTAGSIAMLGLAVFALGLAGFYK